MQKNEEKKQKKCFEQKISNYEKKSFSNPQVTHVQFAKTPISTARWRDTSILLFKFFTLFLKFSLKILFFPLFFVLFFIF